MDIKAAPSQDSAIRLNNSCTCVTLDREKLNRAIEELVGDPSVYQSFIMGRPHLFSAVPVFLSASSVSEMIDIIAAIERVAATPAYINEVLARSPNIAGMDFGTRGALMGYDFHITESGAQLIEINTNAGGAFLNALLADAQLACCGEVELALKDLHPRAFLPAVQEMFQSEWALQRGSAQLRRIAIADDEPESQYLYPEFVIAREMFLRSGIDSIIADAARFTYENGHLLYDGVEIDLVYNRLTDFDLSQPKHQALQRAYGDGAVVVTPGPRHHALLASKRNLIVLSDPVALTSLGISEPDRALIVAHVPRTVLVELHNAGDLWTNRKHYFFKPETGHGSKAVYRGDKLTRGVWTEIIKGGFVAQEFAPPGERKVLLDGAEVFRKVDVRLYTYASRLLLSAARVYQGQTTNFRTPGGGFAPVLAVGTPGVAINVAELHVGEAALCGWAYPFDAVR
jgi:hypothetical protein